MVKGEEDGVKKETVDARHAETDTTLCGIATTASILEDPHTLAVPALSLIGISPLRPAHSL